MARPAIETTNAISKYLTLLVWEAFFTYIVEIVFYLAIILTRS